MSLPPDHGGPAVPDLQPSTPSRSARSSRLTKVLVALAALIGIAGISGMYVKLPYVIFSPGTATPVDDYLRIRGTRSYRHSGEMLLLTVRVSNGRPNLWRYLEASIDDDSQVIGEKQVLGTASRRRVERASVQMMNESQLAAKQAALVRLGYRVTVTGKGARVEQVVEGSPADHAGLRTGDVIVAIDGAPVQLSEQIGEAVQARPAETTFAVTVKRKGAAPVLEVTTAEAPSGPLKGRPYLGIAASTDRLNVEFPVDIQIDAGDVSGPSGGLAFALSIIDDLTPGDLTGGAKVAVTGEINAAGQVGEVGGVPQKAVAAREAGAEMMIVPRAEVQDARAKSGDMEVVGVRTLADALKVLRRHGGAAIPDRPAAA